MTNPFADANEQAQRAAQKSQTTLGTVQSVAPEGHAVLVRPDSADEGSDPVTAFVVEQYAGDSSLPSQGDRVAIQRLSNDTALMLGVVYGDKSDVPNTDSERTLAGISSGAEQVFNGTVTRSSWDYQESSLPQAIGQCGSGVAKLGDWLYVMGGSNGEFIRIDTTVNDFSTIETLSPHPEGWDEVPVCADDTNNVLYMVNGTSGALLKSGVIEYDPSTDSYTTLTTNPPFDSSSGTAAYMNGYIYTHDPSDNNVVEYEISSDTVIQTFGFTATYVDTFTDGSDIICMRSNGTVTEIDVSAGTFTNVGSVSVDTRPSCVWYDESERIFHVEEDRVSANNVGYGVYRTYDVDSDTENVKEVTTKPHFRGAGYYRSSDGTYALFGGGQYPSSVERYLGPSDQSITDNQAGLYTIYLSDSGVELFNKNTGSDGTTLFYKDTDELVTTQVGDLELFRV